MASWFGISPEKRLHALALLAWSDSMEGRSKVTTQTDKSKTECPIVRHVHDCNCRLEPDGWHLDPDCVRFGDFKEMTP
jgi:hypothetical protein